LAKSQSLAKERELSLLREELMESRRVLYEITSVAQDTKSALEESRGELRVLKERLARYEDAERLKQPSPAIEQRRGTDVPSSEPTPTIPALPQSTASLEAAEACAAAAEARSSASDRRAAEAIAECRYWRARAGRAESLLAGEQCVVQAQREALELADMEGEERLRAAEGRYARATVRWERGRERPSERLVGKSWDEEGSTEVGPTDLSGASSALGPWWQGEGEEAGGTEEPVTLSSTPPPSPPIAEAAATPHSRRNRQPLAPRHWEVLASGRKA